MLLSATIVDHELIDTLEVDPLHVQDAEWRDRGIRYLQKVVTLVCGRNWHFRYTSAQVTVPAGPGKTYSEGRVAAPPGFHRCGMQGGIYPAGRPDDRISYLDPTQFFRRREGRRSASSTLSGGFYTVYDFDSVLARPFLFFEPFLTANQDVQVYYERGRPVCSLTAPPVDQLGAFFPEDFEELFKIGLSDWFLLKTGDSRSLEQMSPRFKELLNELESDYLQGTDALKRIGQRGIRRFGMH